MSTPLELARQVAAERRAAGIPNKLRVPFEGDVQAKVKEGAKRAGVGVRLFIINAAVAAADVELAKPKREVTTRSKEDRIAELQEKLAKLQAQLG